MFCKNEDLSGMKFGRWTVGTLAQAGTKRMWHCVCDCGTARAVNAQMLKSGRSQSCGCLQKELVASRSRTHGHSGKPGFNNWMEMKDRCFNPNNNCYKYYGALGVTVCDDIMDFEDFIAAIGPWPGTEYSIGRLDNDLPYTASNIRWETKAQQARNRTMQSSNKSGITGVHLSADVMGGVEYQRWVGKYTTLDGKQKKKSFSVIKHGFDEAKRLAVEFREAGMELLREQGADYGEKHGLPRGVNNDKIE